MLLKVILHNFNDRINVLPRGQKIRDLSNNFLESEAGNDKLPSTDVIPQIFKKKPHLEARWVAENGQLVCKWLCCDGER